MSSPTEPTTMRQFASKHHVFTPYLRQPGEDGYRTPVIEDPEHPAHHRQRTVQSAHSSSTQAFPGLSQGVLQTSSGPEHTSHSEKSHPSHEYNRYHLPEHLPRNLWWQRIKHVTWAYFTSTMATGGTQPLTCFSRWVQLRLIDGKGIANVIATVPTPYRFQGLETIGTIFFLLNIVFYIVIWIMVGLRFYLFPPTFKSSFTHPTESLFAPATVVSLGTILLNIVQYGVDDVGSWLSRATYVLFWLNAALAIVLSVFVYLILLEHPFN